jgi:hypothetical protein
LTANEQLEPTDHEQALASGEPPPGNLAVPIFAQVLST